MFFLFRWVSVGEKFQKTAESWEMIHIQYIYIHALYAYCRRNFRNLFFKCVVDQVYIIHLYNVCMFVNVGHNPVDAITMFTKFL